MNSASNRPKYADSFAVWSVSNEAAGPGVAIELTVPDYETPFVLRLNDADQASRFIAAIRAAATECWPSAAMN